MSKKKHIKTSVYSPQQSIASCIVQFRGQLYLQSAIRQMARIDQQGHQIPKIRTSKKEKLKLRKKLHKINEMDSHELANKIVGNVELVPVVNPNIDERLENEQGEEQYA